MAKNGVNVKENEGSTLSDEQEAFLKETGVDLNATEENIQESNDFMELYEESLKS